MILYIKPEKNSYPLNGVLFSVDPLLTLIDYVSIFYFKYWQPYIERSKLFQHLIYQYYENGMYKCLKP